MIQLTLYAEHACAIASNLGIKRVLIHRYSSLLSAYGISLAEITSELVEPSSLVLSDEAIRRVHERVNHLKFKLENNLRRQDVLEGKIEFQTYLNLQYKGMDTTLSVEETEDEDYGTAFTKLHLREFAFKTNRDIVIDSIRVRAVAKRSLAGESSSISDELKATRSQQIQLIPRSSQKVFLENSWEAVPTYSLDTMEIGSHIKVRHARN